MEENIKIFELGFVFMYANYLDYPEFAECMVKWSTEVDGVKRCPFNSDFTNSNIEFWEKQTHQKIKYRKPTN